MAELQKNNNYIIEITGMTHEGQGVGRINNFTVFVDDALDGETVEIKLIKIAKTYGVGKLINIIHAAPHRAVPFCSAFNRCGGCSLQHMDYTAQLKYKTGVVREAIKRIGKLEDLIIHETIGMEKPFNYRNKAQFPVAYVDGRTVAGFYAKRTHDVVDSGECGIQDELSSKVRAVVREFMDSHKISAYDEEADRGLVRHILVRKGFKTGEVMVVIVVNGNELPHADKLAEMLLPAVPGLKSLILNVNKRKTNVILGSKNITLYGKDSITDYIGRFKFNISPLSFFQVNPIQTEVLYGKALEYAALTGKETVFDLYCGIGTIALFLSEKAARIYGVEVVEEAIRDARENAVVNGARNAEFMVGEAEKVIPDLYARGIRADVVVVDPPRKGCDEALLKTLADMRPQRVVYVSCNPATLARDLAYLEAAGFRAREVQPVDMFPWTPHVETIVLIQRAYT